MKALRALLPTLAGLALLAGCGDQLPSDIPDPITAEGYADSGWAAYADGDFEQAMEYFQAAIEADVSYPGGYLGAGWTSISQGDYWVVADNYFYMAAQLSAGHAPIVLRTESKVQDTLWTVFECVNPVLPDSVYEVLGMLGDTLYDWPPPPGLPQDTVVITPEIIGDYLYGAGIFNPSGTANDYGPFYGGIDFTYRFHTDAPGVLAMLHAVNEFSQENCPVDSIVPDGAGDYWVYLEGNYLRVHVGDIYIRTWICADNVMSYDYATMTPGGFTQDTYDALAGWTLFQHARGGNGDPLLANAATWALDRSSDSYDFGAGTAHDGVVDISTVQLKGMAAAMAFMDEAFRFAWFDCTSEGFGLGLMPTRDDFLPLLLQVIEDMLN